MTLQQITADDIAGWSTLQDIANSFEKRGLIPRPNLGESNELVLQLADDEFVVLVDAEDGESATDYKPDSHTRHTNLVATNDFEEFTFLTRTSGWDGHRHGRIEYQRLSFTKNQFTRASGEKQTVLTKLNSVEYGSSAAIFDTLYDTKQVVEAFYRQFEELRTDLVEAVSGIPDDRSEEKRRYVQVVLDRMMFLYFIQERRLLDRNTNYLHEQPRTVVGDGEDRYENFYRPLCFHYLTGDEQNPDFGSIPYLNSGLFVKSPVEEAFPTAKLGDTAEETNELFDDILDFLSEWGWNLDERLDVGGPKNLSPAILGHIFEQTVNQKEMGAYYTPEDVTGFVCRQTIHPYLLEQLDDAVDADYESIDDVFGFSNTEASGERTSVGDEETLTRQLPTESVETKHVETLYHDVLKEVRILDPSVGSGAFLLAAQDVLVDIYVQCLEFFQQFEAEDRRRELGPRTRDELAELTGDGGGVSLYAKRSAVLNNLYGVDVDEGAVEVCKLRLWLSIVADVEDDPDEVEPLPNIDFNVRRGNSLVGFTTVGEVSSGDASTGDVIPPANGGRGAGATVEELYDDVIEAVDRHRTARCSREATEARRTAEALIETHSEELDDELCTQFTEAGVSEFTTAELSEYSPFHWPLEFASVYQNGGFDVIVGNPPYIRIQELKQSQPALVTYLNDAATFETPYYNYDIAIPFVERCESLLSDSGRLSFIMTNKWIQSRYGAKLRGRLAREQSIERLVDFTDQQVFEGISTYVLILFLTAAHNESIRYSEVSDIGDSVAETIRQIGTEAASERVQSFEASYETLGETPWAFVSKPEAELLGELSSYPSLGDVVEKIFVGIQTSKDPVYVLEIEAELDDHFVCYSSALDQCVTIEKGVTKPLLKGNEFDKWVTNTHSKVVLFPYRIEDTEERPHVELVSKEELEANYPRAFAYLTENKDVLLERAAVDPDHWWHYPYPKNLAQFTDEKIMTSVLNKASKFALDRDDTYVFVGGGNAGGYGVRLPESADISHEYLLSVLNSRLLEWMVQKTSSQFRGGYYSYGKKYIEGLPVASTNHTAAFESLVDDLRSVVESGVDDGVSDAIENVIDVLVYALYLDKEQYDGLVSRVESVYRDSGDDVESATERVESILDDSEFVTLAREVHSDDRVELVDEGKSRRQTFQRGAEDRQDD
ncbi:MULTISPECIES: Eco57I restriction-modification methylase domain-containing protein [Haloferax]|uniref:site-specific DNA-methyltransferase (adenine-specific) n=1 Tax=Haloferax marinum TaxID=2666143 RepID=A0A6A8G941_9EURY|nr:MULTISPECIES: Eco57I restriction-modification methylase domain-containing protein [Haloferax]KAB1198410.1 N-6 DNA methylase [Haloferax sp. CBA1150]MRW97511.1 N-6 DNA methylase [Haloferax marinum]